jgi:transcriptional regulator with GAF, ATPase, and Fis domain
MSDIQAADEFEREKQELTGEVGIRLEREFILNALGRNDWVVELAAREANMSVRGFRELMSKHQINGEVKK